MPTHVPSSIALVNNIHVSISSTEFVTVPNFSYAIPVAPGLKESAVAEEGARRAPCVGVKDEGPDSV